MDKDEQAYKVASEYFVPKLFQWLAVGVLLLSAWLAVVCDLVHPGLTDSTKNSILYMPVFAIVAFACYSLATIGYRVATFNDCLEAADKLKQQIGEAKADLKLKGYKFD